MTTPEATPLTLSERRHMAARLCAETARRLWDLGFGSEIIATWEARSGERIAAHVIKPNPARAALDEESQP